jgi:hypothetical protein
MVRQIVLVCGCLGLAEDSGKCARGIVLSGSGTGPSSVLCRTEPDDQ